MLLKLNAGKRRSSARVTKAEYEALAAFRYNLRQFLHFSESAAETAGVTPASTRLCSPSKAFRDEIPLLSENWLNSSKLPTTALLDWSIASRRKS